MKARLGVETRKSYVILRLCMLVIPQKETYSSNKCKCTATLFFAGLLGVTNGMRPQISLRTNMPFTAWNGNFFRERAHVFNDEHVTNKTKHFHVI